MQKSHTGVPDDVQESGRSHRSIIAEEDVKFVDIRFTDLPGVQQHFNVPAKTVDADFFVNGQLFDGSSIRGFPASPTRTCS